VLVDIAIGNLLSQDSRTHWVLGNARPAPLPSLTLHPDFSTPRESFSKTQCLFNHQIKALIHFQLKSKVQLNSVSGVLDRSLKKSTLLGSALL